MGIIISERLTMTCFNFKPVLWTLEFDLMVKSTVYPTFQLAAIDAFTKIHKSSTSGIMDQTHVFIIPPPSTQ